MRLNLGVDIGVQIQKQFERLSMPSGCDRGRLQPSGDIRRFDWIAFASVCFHPFRRELYG